MMAVFTVTNVQYVATTTAATSSNQVYLELDDQFGNMTQYYQSTP